MRNTHTHTRTHTHTHTHTHTQAKPQVHHSSPLLISAQTCAEPPCLLALCSLIPDAALSCLTDPLCPPNLRSTPNVTSIISSGWGGGVEMCSAGRTITSVCCCVCLAAFNTHTHAHTRTHTRALALSWEVETLDHGARRLYTPRKRAVQRGWHSQNVSQWRGLAAPGAEAFMPVRSGVRC